MNTQFSIKFGSAHAAGHPIGIGDTTGVPIFGSVASPMDSPQMPSVRTATAHRQRKKKSTQV